MLLLSERTLEVGQKLEGFEVKAITDLKQQHMVAYELEHLKTGAKLLHLYSEDAENLFSISFPTAVYCVLIFLKSTLRELKMTPGPILRDTL